MHKIKQFLTPKYGIPLTILGFLLFWLGKWLYLEVLFPERAVLNAVPATSPLVAAFPQARALMQPGDSLLTIPLPGALGEDRARLRQALLRLDSAGQLEEAGKGVLFVQLNGPEGPAMGAIIDLGKRLGRPDQLFAAREVEVTTFQGQEVYHLRLPGQRRLALAAHRNLLLLGRFPFLVEEAVGQQSGRGASAAFVADQRFPDEGLRLWLHTDLLNRRWSGSPNFWPSGWLEITQRVDSARWRLEGRFRSPADQPLPWLAGTSPALPTGILEVLPAQFSWFSWRHCVEPERCWPARNDGPLREQLLPILGAEQAFLVGDLRGAPANADRFWIFETRDGAEAAGRLDDLARQTGLLEDYEYQTYRVRRLLSADLRAPLYDETGRHFENPYCVVLGRYFVMANSRSGLELLIDQYLVGGNLLRSTSFLNYYEENDQPAAAWWMVDPEVLSTLFRQDPVYGPFVESFEQFGLLGFHWRSENGDAAFDGRWKPLPGSEQPGSRYVWRTTLEAETARAPEVLRPAGRPPVVLVQDKANRLYLLDRSGRIIWQTALASPVRSFYTLLDYYRDGAQQLLFNTARGIHLLDLENGRPVAEFPIRLKSPASNGLTVVDRTGQGGYTFFLACENGNVYGYDREGFPLEGWNPRRGLGAVSHPIRHFQQGGQDYFVVLNEAGVVHVLQRDGEDHFPPVDLERAPAGAPGVQLHPRSQRIVACDRAGVAEVINLEGGHFPLPLSRRHLPPVQFAFADVFGDDRQDYIALSGDLLTVEYYEGDRFQQAWRHTFDRRQTELFSVPLPDSKRRAVGTLDADVRQLFLFDAAGELYPGFPLAGTTPFTLSDLYDDGRTLLLTGNANRVVAYAVDSSPQE